MAVLPDVDRNRIWRWFMRNLQESLGVTKADLRAAVDATDTWIENNQTSFNTALPQPFRGSASLTQKTLLFCAVAMRRAGRLKVEEDG